MEITVAKTAGFCFGVDRAVKTVQDLLKTEKTVCTLGPIIHNEQMVTLLKEQGAFPVDIPEKAPPGAPIVIRSHGVEEEMIARIEKSGHRCVDATCPFVKKIHRLVREASEEGRLVLVAGDRDHPEVQGILGHVHGPWAVFQGEQEILLLTQAHPEWKNYPICAVSQTTFAVEEWEKCLKILQRGYTNARIFATICNATAQRQQEAAELAQHSDWMIVIGGHHSSNTAKLREVCSPYCPTTLIETADELPVLTGVHKVGITAGASTPAHIIKEVLVTMSEINESAVLNSTEGTESFAEMLEESLKTLNTDEKVHGVVVGIAPNEVYVDVGRKQAGFIPANELSADPNAKPEDLVKIGDEMDLLIMRTNDQEGTIMLSKKRLDSIKGWETIAAAEESGEVLTGVVTEVIKGGVIAVTNGIRVFIPASQATATRGDSLDDLLKKEVKFRIIEVNRGRRRAVGSIRSVLRDEKKAQAEKFWETAEVNKEYTGVVKSLTAYGAFVDLGGIDGMIHISELSWTRIKHPSEVVNPGDTVTVYIKALDREKGKISLGYKRSEDNPWNILERDYPAGTICEATVVGMTTFGAFANIIPGIDGLIHISQIADHRIEKPQDVLKVGDVVKVKITEIDFDKKRVSLSIRAAAEEAAEQSEE